MALIETGHDGMHHLMVEFLSLDDIGQTYDTALNSLKASRHAGPAQPMIL